MVRIVNKRFQQINLPSDIVDIKNGKVYHTLSGNDGYGLCNLLNELHEENIKIKKNCNRTHKEYAELIDCISDLGYSIIIRNGKVALER